MLGRITAKSERDGSALSSRGFNAKLLLGGGVGEFVEVETDLALGERFKDEGLVLEAVVLAAGLVAWRSAAVVPTRFEDKCFE